MYRLLCHCLNFITALGEFIPSTAIQRSSRFHLIDAPHCLKKNGTLAPRHWSRMLLAQSRRMGRAFGPDSPPTITQLIPSKSSFRGPKRGSQLTTSLAGSCRMNKPHEAGMFKKVPYNWASCRPTNGSPERAGNCPLHIPPIVTPEGKINKNYRVR